MILHWSEMKNGDFYWLKSPLRTPQVHSTGVGFLAQACNGAAAAGAHRKEGRDANA